MEDLDPERDQEKAPSSRVLDALVEAWPQQGTIKKLRIVGSLTVEFARQARFQRQNSMSPSETFSRRALAIGKVLERHGIPLGDERQAILDQASEAFPSGLRE